MAYLSRGLGVRTVYWSATRGEGGQNRTGPERGEALGILRTWESLDARALDGGEVLYGPFYDFGFSRSADDCLARWDHQALVREIVRAIRLIQPEVVVSRWAGVPEDGHGQHQAVGLVVAESFEAAGDPSRFTDLSEPGMPPWQPRKLYTSAIGDWQPGEDVALGDRVPTLDAEGTLRINTGALDPISGRSFQELAWIGANRHQSQSMAFLPARGDYFSYYRLERTLVPATSPEHGFFDGLDPTLPGLADHLGEARATLRSLLEAAGSRAADAVETFRPDHPSEAARPVLEGLAALRRAREALAGLPGDDPNRGAVDRSLERKIAEFEEAGRRCLGIHVDCLVDRARVTPGQRVLASTRVWNGPGESLERADVRLEVPEGWGVRPVEGPKDPEERAEIVPVRTAVFEVTVPETAMLSSPYWLREPRSGYRYVWPEDGPVGLPFDPPLISAVCDIRVGEHRFSISTPAVRRETFVGGSRELPLAVVPPVSLRPRERSELLPFAHRDEHLELQLAVRSLRDDVTGTLAIEAPPGWAPHPPEEDVSFTRAAEVRTIPFELTVPAGAKPGTHPLSYRAMSGHRDYGMMLQPVWRRAPGLPGPADESTCVAEAFIMAPAVVSIHLIEATFVRRLRHAYIRGADEEILRSLERFDLNVNSLAPDDLSYADLSLFDTIVLGPNAYLASEDVRRNASRLLQYAERGGTLIVQYQGYGYEGSGFAPYPFRYRQPHDRVTFPDAPVTMLEPDHPVLTTPNRITEEDFDGWIHDRGLYFLGEWDKRYVPLLESSDPGQEPQRGGLLVASYGRGTFVYAAYSFFRQIPEGVPGAVRLFANLLGLAEARILARVDRVRRIALFSFMEEDQLYQVARLLAERWLDPGTYLCRQGDRGRELYLVLDGEIEVVKGDGGGERVVHVAAPGEVVGELSVLTDLPRSASLRARAEAKVLVMRGAHFREFLRNHVDLAERMTSVLAERLASSEIIW
jgi:LmbE family N-acetylglucosaminyl deacetylase